MKSVIMNMLKLNLLLKLSEISPGSLPSGRSNGTELKMWKENNNISACYEIYSTEVCFPLGTPWANGVHPEGIAPVEPSQINTKFLYFGPGDGPALEIKPEDFEKSSPRFKQNETVNIILHGYQSSCNAYWATMLTAELRRKYGIAICVDWSEGASMPYMQSAGNIRLVAFQLTFFIHTLKEKFGISGSDIHIIGHSLGAHLAGYTGEYLKDIYNDSIGRITGLDPAGPSFFGSPLQARLDPSDAQFVDVIHTGNSPIFGLPLTVGINKYIGHIDFYPNGGKEQNGCNDLKCYHVRACLLYIESIRQSSCKLLAVNCANYEDFVKGLCWGCQNENCAVMGEESHLKSRNTSYHNFFLLTHESSPYCGSHYRISIRVSNSTDSRLHGGEFGNVGVQINGFSESTEEILLFDRSTLLEPNKEFRRVILEYDIGEIISVNFIFHFGSSFMNPMSWRIQTPIVYFDSITVEQLDPERRWSHCFEEEKILSNKNYNFILSNCNRS